MFSLHSHSNLPLSSRLRSFNLRSLYFVPLLLKSKFTSTLDTKYLIFSSTCATYGDPKILPLTEDHPNSPLTSYGKSKLMIEKIFEDYEIAYGIKTVSLRYFNAAGADRDSLIGEDHKPETHLIPNVINTVLGLKNELEIYGNDFDTKDKTAIRDYIHVEDLAIAHLKALEWLLDGNNSEIFNLGTGTGFSVLEIIKEVEKISKTKIKVKFCKRRFGDPPILVANHEKVKKHLNWTISNSNIENIIKTAYNWHRKKVLN